MKSLKENPYWIVVADEASAIVYGRETMRSSLWELFRMENEAGRMKPGELLADRGGRSFDSHGQGRHTMTKEHGPKDHLGDAFAKEIATRIQHAMHTGNCRGYALIATPRFLGRLVDAVDKNVHDKPFLTVDKHVVGRETAFIEGLIAESRPR